MQRFTSIAFRTVFFLGFLIALPVLAIPKVSNLVDSLLYNDAPSLVQPPVVLPPGQQVVEPQFAERASPARYEETLIEDETAVPRRSDGLDNLSAGPPLLSPLPEFNPVSAAPPHGDPPPLVSQLDDAALNRLQQVRERLEQLGAKYVVLETGSGPQQFHFHCEMFVDPRSPYTRNFDATAAHPLEAAESVLREVEGWRLAGNQPAAARQ